ncbi:MULTISPECIES: hypothetical protein [Cupriavidus]|uniref:Uncharacterized protein n=1 Tax=Cupriavidus taiwanensis TaxID=164546 RepID=A0A375IWN3_9BURK|nr:MULTISPECIES: hypothetical protein [Cupriavidus]PVY81087.1 hypothetical protein C7414_102416 [Cupriavidus alkaliphilus]SPR97384.1 conserved hypothetical protein [Cupriavidus taiwanensis]
MTPDQAAIRQAVLDNSRAELLRELQASHRIIRNMLGLLSPSQTAVLAERNARDQVDGEGITRAHEREAVIRRAGGAA